MSMFDEAYEVPVDPLSYSRISSLVTEEVCQTLDENHYVVIDSAVGPALCSALRLPRFLGPALYP